MTGAGDNIIASWCGDLAHLDEKITKLQTEKRETFKRIREEHGRVLADSVKNALRLSRLDEAQMAQHVEIDAETDRVLRIIEASRARSAGAPHARVRTRVREEAPEHDADGVITEPAAPVPSGEAADTPEGSDDSRASGDPIPPEVDAPEAAQTGPDLSGPFTAPAESEAVAISAPLTEAERLMQRALAKNPRRPHCLRPDLCASSNPREHCFTCAKAHADAEGISA